jgi:histone H4
MLGKNLGKGAKGKYIPKRHKVLLRDNLQKISKNDLRRLARRGGVKKMSGLIYDEVRNSLKDFLTKILHDVNEYTLHDKRKTVTPFDVVCALKRHGRGLYGFT